MGHCSNNEAISLHKTSTVPLKFPLGLFPPTVRPYLELIRLEKPTGTKLVFWPFAWGLTMAAYRTNLPIKIYWIVLLKCFFGAFILRSSACAINDIFDRKVDGGVERTKNRPLPSGRVSASGAFIFTLVQYIVGICFFFLTTHGLAFYVALFHLLPLCIIYPLLKRVTYWPQAWLGFAMNFGFITAWVSVTGSVDGHLLPTGMLGCWCWTMLYDTIYACQDIRDDIEVGVRSTAILFGTWIRSFLMLFAAVFMSMLTIAGYLNKQGFLYYIISVGGTTVHLIWQFSMVDLEIPSSCGKTFNRNGQLGWVIWAGLVLDYFFELGVTRFCF